MAHTKLRLVHSSSSPTETNPSREEWGFENAVQLSLFDASERHHLKVVDANNCSPSFFSRILHTARPSLVVDTRAFPDFFTIFHSTKHAFKTFEDLKIPYILRPIEWNGINVKKTPWEIRCDFVDTLEIAGRSITYSDGLLILITPNTESQILFLESLAKIPEINLKWHMQRA
jgi:hypothetical protein